MQHYDTMKTRRRRSLILGYGVMTLAVGLISVICILLVLGYRFDNLTHRVEQGALLQFSSLPSGATIVVDGEKQGFVTPGKQDVSAGTHDVTFTKKGYRNWSKRLSVRAGELRWLNYARLVPTTIATSAVKEFGVFAAASASPNRKWLAVLEKADTPTVTFIDLSDNKQPKYISITIPSSALTMPSGSVHTYELLEWDANSDGIVMRHRYGGGEEYIRISPTRSSDVVNITTKFGLNFSDVQFSSSDILYGIESGNLRRIDVGTGSLSEPLMKNIVTFRLYGEKDVIAVRHKDAAYSVELLVDNKTNTIASYDDTIAVHIALTKYFGDRYAVISRGASFELVKNPEKSAKDGMEKVVTMTYPVDIQWLDVSKTGRHVIAGNGSLVVTYDIELARRSDSVLPGVAAGATQPVAWLDDFLLVSATDNKLRLCDFDGDNQQIVVDALPGAPAVLSGDNTLLYSFAKNSAGTVSLQVSQMTVR